MFVSNKTGYEILESTQPMMRVHWLVIRNGEDALGYTLYSDLETEFGIKLTKDSRKPIQVDIKYFPESLCT